MLVFRELTAGNLKEFEQALSASELNFPESIRSTYDDFIDILEGDNAIGFIALLDSVYIGNILGSQPTEYDIKDCGIELKTDITKVIYIYNFVIEKEYQGKGHGYRLLLEFLKTAKERGYEIAFAQVRKNGSFALMKKAGATEKGVSFNWEDTGEDFVLCELDLRQFRPEQATV